MPQQTATASRGHERLGKRVLHVEGLYKDPATNRDAAYHFNVRRRFWARKRLGSISDKELESVRERLAQLPGSPETAIIQKGRSAENETVTQARTLRRRRINKRLNERVATVRNTIDLDSATIVSRSLVGNAIKMEQAQHKTLADSKRTLPVGDEVAAAARFLMYPGLIPHNRLAQAAAKEIIQEPEFALRETVRYLEYYYVEPNAKGERLTFFQKVFTHKWAIGALSAVPLFGQIITLLDDLNFFTDLPKPGTLRGKIFQAVPAFGSDFLIGGATALAGLLLPETLGASISIPEIVAPVVNVITNPNLIEGAKRRVDDERFMLQAQTAIQLLKPESGITDLKKREIAAAALKSLSKSRMKNIGSVIATGDPTDPKTYYARLLNDLYTAAQDYLKPKK